ncbi:23S rRNA (guanosine(2251)-2'-O)-methyltransferase RlmB [Hyphococcus sp.]|uniref:23S rRNA (guanosine(2251)-2'-O)-methyltransferase RlmB n=1 Tax=Hyphococcus sp. TaxID=2038636 RepID=UPI0037522ED8
MAPAKSSAKRPSARARDTGEHKTGPLERPAKARAGHKAQSRNDRQKTRRGSNEPAAAKNAPQAFKSKTDRNSKPSPSSPASPLSLQVRSRPEKKKQRPNHNGGLWIYGRHAVAAVLANPERKIRHVHATQNAAEWLAKSGASGAALSKLEDARPEIIDELLQEGAVHQGLAALVDPLPRNDLKTVCLPAETGRPVLILDQITDPQNIGALFRSAAAFGARAVVVQDRRTPPLSGALAKAAAGAIEKVACVEVVNIARTIEALREMGYFCAGLAGEAQAEIGALPAAPLALVMGAEGDGLRRLVAEKCDQLFCIPIHSHMESLNVSTAAAISLYEARRPR